MFMSWFCFLSRLHDLVCLMGNRYFQRMEPVLFSRFLIVILFIKLLVISSVGEVLRIPPNLLDSTSGKTSIGFDFSYKTIDTLIMDSGQIVSVNGSNGNAFAINMSSSGPSKQSVIVYDGALVCKETNIGACSFIKISKDSSRVSIYGGEHQIIETGHDGLNAFHITGSYCKLQINGGNYSFSNMITPNDVGDPLKEGRIFSIHGDSTKLILSGGNFKNLDNFETHISLYDRCYAHLDFASFYPAGLDIDGNGYVQDTAGVILGKFRDGNIVEFKFTRDIKAQLQITGTTPAKEVYVSSALGDDMNKGTDNAPFETIEKAVREVYGGGTIKVMGGTYNKPIIMSGLRGSQANPIRIESVSGEHVRFDGSVNIKDISEGNWERYKSNIYRIKLTRDIWQLWVDEELQTSARWPNATWKDGDIWDYQNRWTVADSGYSDSAKNIMMVRARAWTADTSLDLAKSGVDVTGSMAIQNFGNYNTYCRKVISHEPGKPEVYHELSDPAPQGPFANGVEKLSKLGYKLFFFEGTPALVDVPTEWAYDKKSKFLYLFTDNGKSPEGRNVRGKVQTYFFDLEESSHIQIKGIEFFGTTVCFLKCENVTVEDCDFLYPSYSKRMLGLVGSADPTRFVSTLNRNAEGKIGGNHTVRNCTFYRADGDGITMQGGGNVIDNCLFKEIDYSCIDGAVNNHGFSFFSDVGNDGTVHTYGATGVSINRVTIHTAGNAHNLMTGRWNPDTPYIRGGSITNCHLERCGLAQIQDGANVHIWQWGRGHADVSHIWTHDSYKTGVRSDGGVENPPPNDSSTFRYIVSWDRVKERVVDGFGIRTREGAGIGIHGEAHKVDHTLSMDNGREGSMGTSQPNSIRYNNAGDKLADKGIISAEFDQSESTIKLKSLLRDPANWDFRPSSNSLLVDAGLPLKGINDGFVGAAPDIGAYEYGAKKYWIPGYKASVASTPVPPLGGENVKLTADLMWLEAYKAVSHNIYFGTDAQRVLSATTTDVEFKGNKNTNIYTPSNALLPNTRYYWRVDAVKSDGAIDKGTLWDFSTATYPLCTLQYKSSGNGSIEGNSHQVISYGKEGTPVSAIPNVGYSFSSWSDGDKNNPRVDVNVKMSHTITAQFVKNPEAGIAINKTTIAVAESGLSEVFYVELATEPSSDVTIAFKSSDTTEAVVFPNIVTFHTGDWNTPKVITVKGVDDKVGDGDVISTIECSVSATTDTHYKSLEPNQINVINQDDDLGIVRFKGLSDSSKVYMFATNSWKGIKVLSGNGAIQNLSEGSYLFRIEESGKRTELCYLSLGDNRDTTIEVSLGASIPYAFNKIDTLKSRLGSAPLQLQNIVLTVEDIDYDKDPDLITIDRSSGEISVFTNNEGYELENEYAIELREGEVAIGVEYLIYKNENSLLIGANSGTIFLFTFSDNSVREYYKAQDGLSGFDIIDQNSDSHPDLILGYENGTFEIVQANGPDKWGTANPVMTTDKQIVDVGTMAIPLQFDINGDGYLDLITGNDENSLIWFEGNNSNSFIKKDSINCIGGPFTAKGKISVAFHFNEKTNMLPRLTIHDENGYLYQMEATLLGDINNDGEVFLDDYSLFVDSWRSTENDSSWNWNANLDVTPNRDGKQEVSLEDFMLFVDSWRKRL